MRSPSTELIETKLCSQWPRNNSLVTCASVRTYEELLLQLLRNRKRCNKKFRRQHAIGIYVADFYCAEEKLIVEIDGRDHCTEQGRVHDEARDRFMHSQGIRVLRFTVSKLRLNQNGC